MAIPAGVPVHAMRHSQTPVEAAFVERWPEAQRTNILDDSLATDLSASGAIGGHMIDRFLRLGRYAASLESDAIPLFTCSDIEGNPGAKRRDYHST